MMSTADELFEEIELRKWTIGSSIHRTNKVPLDAYSVVGTSQELSASLTASDSVAYLGQIVSVINDQINGQADIVRPYIVAGKDTVYEIGSNLKSLYVSGSSTLYGGVTIGENVQGNDTTINSISTIINSPTTTIGGNLTSIGSTTTEIKSSTVNINGTTTIGIENTTTGTEILTVFGDLVVEGKVILKGTETETDTVTSGNFEITNGDLKIIKEVNDEKTTVFSVDADSGNTFISGTLNTDGKATLVSLETTGDAKVTGTTTLEGETIVNKTLKVTDTATVKNLVVTQSDDSFKVVNGETELFKIQVSNSDKTTTIKFI